MKKLPVLKPGDSVEIIAPASRCSCERLLAMKTLFEGWGLNCLIAHDIFGDDLLCANSDSIRFNHLKDALKNPQTKAIICARGGYGSMRLIPMLTHVIPPDSPKMLVGMSDITALHLLLNQRWHWPSIHGAVSPDDHSPESIALIKSLLFAEERQIVFTGVMGLNHLAKKSRILEASITGGNLSLIQASIGTSWQLDGQGRFILLEDIGERAYRIDRMLEHLRQANLFKHAAGIIFGDFLNGEEPNGSSLIGDVLTRFADSCDIPVVQVKGVGHGYVNYPIPLGIHAMLYLGSEIKLICSR